MVHWTCGGDALIGGARDSDAWARGGGRERTSRESVVDAVMCGARVR